MANYGDLGISSPIFSNNLVEISPMTDLANNLNSTKLAASARRKLSLCSNDSPASAVGTPISPDRLLNTSLKFGGPGTPVGVAPRKPGFVRRLSALGDENYNPMQSSPAKHSAVSPSKFLAVRQVTNGSSRVRQPLEDCDPNSQDSGYCFSDDSKSTSLPSDFPFAQPSGFAPRRSAADSPRRSLLSSSSNDSLDDGFSDFISPLQDEEAQLPPGLGGLIKDPIINQGVSSDNLHYNFHQAISENVSPMSPDVEEVRSKKRPSTSHLEVTPVSKRVKSQADTPTPLKNTLFAYGFRRLAEPRPLLGHSMSLEEPVTPPVRPKFRHCLSESEADIKRALHRSSEEELIGDFSRKFALPLVPGHHQDLKSITPATLARLINGEFTDNIASYQIVDCRYPYEYDGGHIRGAVNLYTKDMVLKELLEDRPAASPTDELSKRHIVVFHCEFSSERGPGMSRFLRSKDRDCNAYPFLHHPEVYLLEGGYKAFYLSHSELCEPCAYRRMLDANKEELQHFRAKSKTWSGDKSNRVLKRSASFKRLGL